MKVFELIAKLRLMPRNDDVGVAAHDNSIEECAGWVNHVLEFNKEDFDIDDVEDQRMFKDMPKRCVILRC